MAEKRNPGALAGATGAEKPSHATAAGLPKIAQEKPQRYTRGGLYHIIPEGGRMTRHRLALLAWGASDD